MVYITYYDAPLGRMLLAADETNLKGLWWQEQMYFADTIDLTYARRDDALPVLQDAKRWLDAYFAGQNPSLASIPLAPQGSTFRQMVWELLCQIPYGQVTTYGRIAQMVAERMHRAHMSSQAVGGAVGHNPISILIPCHRVVGSDGSLTGYAGGIERKKQLLEHEGVDVLHLHTFVKR